MNWQNGWKSRIITLSVTATLLAASLTAGTFTSSAAADDASDSGNFSNISILDAGDSDELDFSNTSISESSDAITLDSSDASRLDFSSTSAARGSQAVEKVIAAGVKYRGTPYEFGANRASTSSFDCSSFVRRAFLDGVGIRLPSSSRGQAAYVQAKGSMQTDWRKLKRGDLMYFMSYRGTSAFDYRGMNKKRERITHTGIYLGDGKVLHTYSNEGGGVTVSSIVNKHWEYRFLFGGSAL